MRMGGQNIETVLLAIDEPHLYGLRGAANRTFRVIREPYKRSRETGSPITKKREGLDAGI